MLNVPELSDHFGPTGCQIVECFSTFDNLGLIGNQVVGSTATIRQFGMPHGALLLNFDRQSPRPVSHRRLLVNTLKLMTQLSHTEKDTKGLIHQ